MNSESVRMDPSVFAALGRDIPSRTVLAMLARIGRPNDDPNRPKDRPNR